MVPEDVEAMTAALAHRGPDDAGLHVAGRSVLGHRRLSIVDLEHGAQPIVDGHGADEVVVVVNGEIYNAPLLRTELGGGRPWLTASDSEVVLRLLDGRDRDPREDAAAAARLRGMYAFAVQRDGELVFGRDPVGIKPLYLGRRGPATVFASEVKAFPPGTHDVAPLAPGTLWSSRSGVTRFAAIPGPNPVPGTADGHVRAVRAALERSVERHLMADVPVGAFLSGGLDSSAICALVGARVPDLHTFAVGLAGSPDLAAARRVAEHLGTVHHERVIDPGEVAAALPHIVWALESTDPDLVRSAVPTWFVAELAARHVKVVLTGEGADELFAGYRYHADVPRHLLHAELRRSLGEMHHVNLQRVDRMTMAHSLEARVPFLDLDFVDAALRVPVELKLPAGGPEKWVLREAVADLLPSEIVWRTKAQFDEGSGVGDLVDRALADSWAQAGGAGDEPLRAVLASVASPEMVAHVAAVAGRWDAGRLGDVA
ncbi:asparagine synthase (glutamine-hydrolysing) [Geodermatophilus pulveris]|uniref:asparagine synthase (glutamine-hydrolyzing) n=1 Tax=Geodermatophilus pulveris TaxID=1564159 RepID=A0A239FU66_9ACTN|nr:asparagine synthase-related protein [Geodermatophilus pulveris]SNS59464.1 asparagine synthase (glutamine-hydrolysing) [Geodermatophilus pulveris]